MRKTVLCSLFAFLAAFQAAAQEYQFRMNYKGLVASASEEDIPLPEGDFLKVLNPVPGVSGIYNIHTGDGGIHPAYVNMEIPGGPWILIAKWQAPMSPTAAADNLVVKDSMLVTSSNATETYPVLPAGTKNVSDRVLFTSDRPSWVALNGAWQAFDTFPQNYVYTASGFPVLTPSGEITMYGYDVAWGRVTTVTHTGFSLWTHPNNSGPCGGRNRGGYDHMCPYSGTYVGAHMDWTGQKMLYLKEKLP